jgi:hypothetical protein
LHFDGIATDNRLSGLAYVVGHYRPISSRVFETADRHAAMDDKHVSEEFACRWELSNMQ